MADYTPVKGFWQANASESAPSMATLSSQGYPTNGDPRKGTPATIPGAAWYYWVDQAIRAVIAASGKTSANPPSPTELRDALQSLGWLNEKSVKASMLDLDNIADSSLSATSTRPVQNKVINSALDGKLSTSGGTMTGTLKIHSGVGTLRLQTYGATGSTTTNSGAHVATLENDSYLEVHPGNPGEGAALFMASSDYSGDALYKGCFLLRSMSPDKTSNYDLRGAENGMLTWRGHEVVRVVSSGKSADGTQWYRKYNDGYIEQAGRFDNGSDSRGFSTDITFLAPFSSSVYSVQVTPGATKSTMWDGNVIARNISTTSMTIAFWGTSESISARYLYWFACGY